MDLPEPESAEALRVQHFPHLKLFFCELNFDATFGAMPQSIFLSDLGFDILLQDGVDKLAEEGPHRDEDRVQPLGTLLSMRSQDASVAKGLPNKLNIQGWTKEWSLGCVIPASWLLLAVGARFTQPRDHSFNLPCR